MGTGEDGESGSGRRRGRRVGEAGRGRRVREADGTSGKWAPVLRRVGVVPPAAGVEGGGGGSTGGALGQARGG